MRRSRGALLPPVRNGRFKRGEVYRAIRSALLDGALAPGERLPSTRQAAEDYGVSRGVLEEVFAQLTDEGFLERAIGRGTFVAKTVTRLNEPPKRRASRPPSRRGIRIATNAACREPEKPRAFNAGIADTSEFPWRIWHRLQTRASREMERDALSFADPRGLPQLRSAIAHYLAQFRGFRCGADRVIVFNSAQQALYALAVLLLDRGDRVWLEDPCYLGARAAFELAGASIAPIPVDDEGMRIDIGIRRARNAKLAYVTPPHQYPTGVALSLDRRIELLEWASRNDGWIIDDDYDGEFRYEGQPLTPLFSLDSRARVLYLGTLNKAMFVSLRLAYVVVPEELIEPLANIRTQLDGFTPALPQMAMSFFMDEGYFSSHLRRMRALYGAKRSALTDALEPLAARGWTWPSNPAGIHLLASHAHGSKVRRIAKDSELDLALLSSYRLARRSDDGLFLRFGALDARSVRDGARALTGVAQKTI